MKNPILATVIFSLLLITAGFAQAQSEKENVEAVAAKYLTAAAAQSTVSSGLIAAESLDKSKEMYIKMALSFDSTGKSNAMMLLPANKAKAMTSAEVWDYSNKSASMMKKLDMKIEWNITNTEIKDDSAFVTYNAKEREPKVMQLKKENSQWKVVLSYGSIF